MAQSQEIVTEWTSRDGFVLDGRVFADDWWKHHCDIYGHAACNIRHFNYFVSFLLCTVFMVIIPVFLHYKGPKRGRLKEGKYKKRDPAYDLGHSLLWNTFGVSIILSFAAFFTEFIRVTVWIRSTPHTQEGIFFFWVVVYLFLALLTSACVSFRKHNIDLLTPSHAMLNGLFCGLRWDVIILIVYHFSCNRKLCQNHCKKCYENTNEQLKKCQDADKFKNLMATWLLLTLYFMIYYIILSILPVVLFFILHPDRTSAFYIFIISAVSFLIYAFTAADFERRVRKERHINKQMEKKFAKSDENDTDSADTLQKELEQLREVIHEDICKSLFWFKGHFFFFISFVALLFVIIVSGIFVVVYHSLVAQSHSNNVLLTVVKAFIPALLFSSPLWLKKWLKHHYRLDTSQSPNVGAVQEMQNPV